MSEQINLEQNSAPGSEIIKERIFKDIEKWRFSADDLAKIPAELHNEIALKLLELEKGLNLVGANVKKFRNLSPAIAPKLIKAGYHQEVAENLFVFSSLDKKVALLLVKAGHGLEVMNNMDYFDGLDSNLVAEAMLLCGQGGFVRLNQELFGELNSELLEKINDHDYRQEPADWQKIFGKGKTIKKRPKQELKTNSLAEIKVNSYIEALNKAFPKDDDEHEVDDEAELIGEIRSFIKEQKREELKNIIAPAFNNVMFLREINLTALALSRGFYLMAVAYAFSLPYVKKALRAEPTLDNKIGFLESIEHHWKLVFDMRSKSKNPQANLFAEQLKPGIDWVIQEQEKLKKSAN